tara:strand:- start:2136 stop:3872 length:1737 start_codon:yes stop_codon:yes gene_type:complete
LAAALLLLERFPRIQRTRVSTQHRWVTNIGLTLLGALLLSILFPVNIAEVITDMPAGRVVGLDMPLLVEIAVVFLLLDFVAYWEHRLMHEVPLFWRIHLVHHSDTALDVTTGQRHHPLEKIVSVIIGFMMLFALGFSVQALAFYALVTQLSALYTHANIGLPESIERQLRGWLVTPAVHAVHHSSYQPETDSNYGGVLTVWDRLFGTYSNPRVARIPSFGLEYFRREGDSLLLSVLAQPFTYSRKNVCRTPAQQVAVPRISDDAFSLSPQWRQALLYWIGGLILALFALWPTVFDLTQQWSNSIAYQYAWLVLPVFIYVAGWYHRDNILAMTPRPSWAGLPILAAAIALWGIAYIANIKLGTHIALVMVMQAIVLCAMGGALYRRWLPLMLLLFLMVPCGDLMQPLLRDLTVKWVEWFAVATALPHTVDGYYLLIGEHEYEVLDACSGLAFFTLGGFLGYSFGLLLFRSIAKIVALAVLGATLGILTNALRVCLIVALDQMRGTQMDLAGHTDIQWLVWLTSLSLLLYLSSRLTHDNCPIQTENSTENQILVQPATRFSPIVAGVLLVVSTSVMRGLW